MKDALRLTVPGGAGFLAHRTWYTITCPNHHLARLPDYHQSSRSSKIVGPYRSLASDINAWLSCLSPVRELAFRRAG